VQRNRRYDVDGIDGIILQGIIERSPGAHAGISLGLAEITRHHAIKFTARFGQNAGDDAFRREIADSNHQPAQHDNSRRYHSPRAFLDSRSSRLLGTGSTFSMANNTEVEKIPAPCRNIAG